MASKGKNSIELTTPIVKKSLKSGSESDNNGVVTQSPKIKTKKSIKHRTKTNRSLKSDKPSVASKRKSDKISANVPKVKKGGKSGVVRDLNFDNEDDDTSGGSSNSDMSTVPNKVGSSKKVPPKNNNMSKPSSQSILCAFKIDWTDSILTRNEVRKYTKTDHIDQSQEAILPFLLDKYKPNDIKTSFAALISKSNVDTERYYPMPSVKAKLIESFIELIFDEKSMMVSSSKIPST